MSKRHPNFIDLTGQTFPHLTVLSYAGNNKQGKSTWLVRCQKCNSEKVIAASVLKRKGIKSCGCARGKLISETKGTHRSTKTVEYQTWLRMVARCENPRHQDYKNYGGRGIGVCREWRLSPEKFMSDMGPRPGPKYSIERLDVNGNYAPENCRWADYKTQARNRRNSKRLTLNGKTLTVAEWAERLNRPHTALYKRIDLGWSDERILTEEVKSYLGRKKSRDLG